MSAFRKPRDWQSDSARATVGFEKFSNLTQQPAKSMMRMFGTKGNSRARYLFEVIAQFPKRRPSSEHKSYLRSQQGPHYFFTKLICKMIRRNGAAVDFIGYFKHRTFSLFHFAPNKRVKSKLRRSLHGGVYLAINALST
jgi:hypothetical protein